MRTGIVSVHLTHAMGRSRAKTESDTSVLLESITRARNHREIAYHSNELELVSERSRTGQPAG